MSELYSMADFLMHCDLNNWTALRELFLKIVCPLKMDAIVYKSYKNTFVECFHIKVTTFQHIYNTLSKFRYFHERKENLTFYYILPLDKQLLLTIYLMANTEPFGNVAHRFGISENALNLYFQYIIRTLSKMWFITSRWPAPDEISVKKKEFENAYNIRNVIGVLHTFTIRQDMGERIVPVQIIVDSQWHIFDVCISDPLCNPNSYAFHASTQYYNIKENRGACFPNGEKLLTNNKHPGHSWLIPPFPTGSTAKTLNEIQKHFNKLHEAAIFDVYMLCRLLRRRFRGVGWHQFNKHIILIAMIRSMVYLHNLSMRCKDYKFDLDGVEAKYWDGSIPFREDEINFNQNTLTSTVRGEHAKEVLAVETWRLRNVKKRSPKLKNRFL